MSHSRSSRVVSLFSSQARGILKEPLLLLRHTTTGQETRCENEAVIGQPDVELPGFEEPRGAASELQCLSCHVMFDVRAEQVPHYRLDWHRYNLKRKLKGLTHVTQEEFEMEAGDLSSISGSESDSEGTEESVQTTPLDSAHPTGAPFVYFTSGDDQTVYSVYRVVLSGGKEYVSSVPSLSQPRLWIILMRAGGHFAGAVFSGSAVLVHKTFHRYTVRAKRGTAQSARDAQSGGHGPKSAGASLRRYNEAALAQEVQDLLASWSVHVEGADVIFIRTPKGYQSIFTGGRNPPLSRDDPRIRGIPFVTRRPTFKEVKRVHSCLAAIYVGGVAKSVATDTVPMVADSAIQLEISVSVRCEDGEGRGVVSVDGKCDSGMGEDGEGDGEKKRKKKKTKKRKKVDKEEAAEREQPAGLSCSLPAVAPPPELGRVLRVCEAGGEEAELEGVLQSLGLSQLYCRELAVERALGDQPSELQTMSRSVSGQVESSGQTSGQETRQETGQVDTREASPSVIVTSSPHVLNMLHGGASPLHVASERGHAALVRVLLHYGADPTTRDSSGRVPYLVVKEKPVRDCYRRFMAQQPTAYDYAAAQIPSPLTEDMERDRKDKVAERRREKKRHSRQKQREERAGREEEEVQEKQTMAMAGMSEREKRAMAAEKRMAQRMAHDSSVQRAGVCTCCGRGLAGLVPFYRLQYQYCSMPCVREHRAQLAS